MKKGFTLIELIFVIVIIGVLAAVAVPKFSNLKGNAEVNNIIKIVMDAESSVPPAAMNLSDLDNNTTYELDDILKLSGPGISFNDLGTNTNLSYYAIKESGGISEIAKIDFNRNTRTLVLTIDCDNFISEQSKTNCKEKFDSSSNTFNGSKYENTIKF